MEQRLSDSFKKIRTVSLAIASFSFSVFLFAAYVWASPDVPSTKEQSEYIKQALKPVTSQFTQEMNSWIDRQEALDEEAQEVEDHLVTEAVVAEIPQIASNYYNLLEQDSVFADLFSDGLFGLPGLPGFSGLPFNFPSGFPIGAAVISEYPVGAASSAIDINSFIETSGLKSDLAEVAQQQNNDYLTDMETLNGPGVTVGQAKSMVAGNLTKWQTVGDDATTRLATLDQIEIPAARQTLEETAAKCRLGCGAEDMLQEMAAQDSLSELISEREQLDKVVVPFSSMARQEMSEMKGVLLNGGSLADLNLADRIGGIGQEAESLGNMALNYRGLLDKLKQGRTKLRNIVRTIRRLQIRLPNYNQIRQDLSKLARQTRTQVNTSVRDLVKQAPRLIKEHLADIIRELPKKMINAAKDILFARTEPAYLAARYPARAASREYCAELRGAKKTACRKRVASNWKLAKSIIASNVKSLKGKVRTKMADATRLASDEMRSVPELLQQGEAELAAARAGM